jgi:hypothetical protein
MQYSENIRAETAKFRGFYDLAFAFHFNGLKKAAEHGSVSQF